MKDLPRRKRFAAPEFCSQLFTNSTLLWMCIFVYGMCREA